MASAGNDAPSPTLLATTLFNAALIAVLALQFTPAGQAAPMVAVLMLLAVLGFGAAWWLWWHPWRWPLMLVVLGVMLATVVLALIVRWRMPDRDERAALRVALGVAIGLMPLLLWFLTVWRAQQIDGRLREQAERQRSIEMACRLAAAQLEPHFLFNTLASLQHWVHTKDERAAPMLDALTGYLRATLPMFNRALQPVGDELEAVRRYLDVMRARFGERLRFGIDVPAPLLALPLPPGLLLTLVENAVEHGIEPRVAGGTLTVSGRREGDDVLVEVIDDGPGPAPGAADGIGLANSRERLALAYGERAQLTVAAGAGGGCTAAVRVRWAAP
jgi:signal transduction histidine kinase